MNLASFIVFLLYKFHMYQFVLHACMQERFVRAWIRNWELRESVVEKQIELQQVVAWIKLYEILMPQIDLLQEWPALETKYRVGLSRLIRKLSAFSCLVPILEDGAQVRNHHTFFCMSKYILVLGWNIYTYRWMMYTQLKKQWHRHCKLWTASLLMQH